MNAFLAYLQPVLTYLPTRLRTFFVHICTESDNQTFSGVHVGVALGGLSMIGVFIFLAVTRGVADYALFGGGLGGLLALGGHGVAKVEQSKGDQ